MIQGKGVLIAARCVLHCVLLPLWYQGILLCHLIMIDELTSRVCSLIFHCRENTMAAVDQLSVGDTWEFIQNQQELQIERVSRLGTLSF